MFRYVPNEFIRNKNRYCVSIGSCCISISSLVFAKYSPFVYLGPLRIIVLCPRILFFHNNPFVTNPIIPNGFALNTLVVRASSPLDLPLIVLCSE